MKHKIILLLVILSFGLFSTGCTAYSAQEQTQEQQDETEQVQTEAESEEDRAEPQGPPEMLAHCEEWYSINPDTAGWLCVSNTKIKYPVMYTPDNPNYYLNRSATGKYSELGIPYIGAYCSPDSRCVIVHGHNTPEHRMFGDLDYYKDREFTKWNPVIFFDSLYEYREYTVFAVAECKVLYPGEEGLGYYDYGGDISEREYDELVQWLKESSMHRIDDGPDDYQQILILSTCGDLFVSRNRFIVAAYRTK